MEKLLDKHGSIELHESVNHFEFNELEPKEPPKRSKNDLFPKKIRDTAQHCLTPDINNRGSYLGPKLGLNNKNKKRNILAQNEATSLRN